jgi:hypothetical protein
MELLNKDGAAPQVATQFNGQFVFSNPDTEDFTGMWNGTAYTFKALSTSPFYILDANPIETQEIRKQFARKLGERMFGKSKKYIQLEKDSEGKPVPKFYDYAREIQPFVDQCLKPLPKAQPVIKKVPQKEHNFKIDPKTKKQVVQVYGEDDQNSVSLIDEAQNATD